MHSVFATPGANEQRFVNPSDAYKWALNPRTLMLKIIVAFISFFDTYVTIFKKTLCLKFIITLFALT